MKTDKTIEALKLARDKATNPIIKQQLDEKIKVLSSNKTVEK